VSELRFLKSFVSDFKLNSPTGFDSEAYVLNAIAIIQNFHSQKNGLANSVF
jgi:hypothetical protein